MIDFTSGDSRPSQKKPSDEGKSKGKIPPNNQKGRLVICLHLVCKQKLNALCVLYTYAYHWGIYTVKMCP